MRNPFARRRSPEATAEQPPARHLAHVELRSTGEYFVTTYSYAHRIAILDGPAVILAPGASLRELGTQTLAALLRSGSIVAPANLRTDPVPSLEGLLKQAKVKTYTGYMRDTKSIGIFAEFDGEVPGTYEVTPYERDGGRGARSPMIDEVVTEPYSTPEALGAAVLAALDIATT